MRSCNNKSYICLVFLALILLISLVIGTTLNPLYEGQSIIKDNDKTYVVGGNYTQDGNGNIRKMDGTTVNFGDITEQKKMTRDANGRTSTNDAEGDSQYIVDASGNVNKNEIWNADSAFPDYHDSANSIIERDPRLKQKKVYVKGKDGKVMEIPWDGSKTDINYNETGYFRYQPSNFVPGYEDSVYLSRTTGLSTIKPIENTASKMGGFCEYHKHSPIKIEQECGKLEKDSCASTSCCVLLGGSRCVGGNEKGPTMKANYSDITILNRDHYFYKGKCYGNCPP
jgi:hypothetical protein